MPRKKNPNQIEPDKHLFSFSSHLLNLLLSPTLVVTQETIPPKSAWLLWTPFPDQHGFGVVSSDCQRQPRTLIPSPCHRTDCMLEGPCLTLFVAGFCRRLTPRTGPFVRWCPGVREKVDRTMAIRESDLAGEIKVSGP